MKSGGLRSPESEVGGRSSDRREGKLGSLDLNKISELST